MKLSLLKKASLGTAIMCMSLGGITFTSSVLERGHADTLPQLATPTNVTLGNKGYNSGIRLEFDEVSNATGYSVDVKDGETTIMTITDYFTSEDEINVNIPINKEGTYTVSITAIGDGKNYSDSDPAISEEHTVSANNGVGIDGNYINFDQFSMQKDNDYFYYSVNGCITKITDYTNGDFWIEFKGDRVAGQLFVDHLRPETFSTDEDTKVIRPGHMIYLIGLSGGNVYDFCLRDVSHFEVEDDFEEALYNLTDSFKQSLSVSYTETINGKADGYGKVNDASDLNAGDTIIFNSEDAATVMTCGDGTYVGTALVGSYRDTIGGSFIPSSYEFVLCGEAGAWTFKSKEFDNLYLCNDFYHFSLEEDEGSNITTWTISITDGDAAITPTTGDFLPMAFSANWEDFGCTSDYYDTYDSAPCSVQIYKAGQVDNYEYSINQNESKNEIAIQVGSFFTKGIYDEINNATSGKAEYGCLYAIGTEEFGYSDLSCIFWAELNNDEEPLSMEEVLTKYPNVHKATCTPVRVDENGNADEDGEYYQFGVSIENIPSTDFDTTILVANYVLINGTYCYFDDDVIETSVSDLAESYLYEFAYMPEIRNYAGILNYLMYFED